MALPARLPEKLIIPLNKLSSSVKDFSSHFLSLYVEDTTGGNWLSQFHILRDKTALTLINYFQMVLPIYGILVENIDDFFDQYKNFKFETWLKRLDKLITKVNSYQRVEENLPDIMGVTVTLEEIVRRLNVIEANMAAETRAHNDGANAREERKAYSWWSLGKKQDDHKIMEKDKLDYQDIRMQKKSPFDIVKNNLIPSAKDALSQMQTVAKFFPTIAEDLKKLKTYAYDLPESSPRKTKDKPPKGKTEIFGNKPDVNNKAGKLTDKTTDNEHAASYMIQEDMPSDNRAKNDVCPEQQQQQQQQQQQKAENAESQTLSENGSKKSSRTRNRVNEDEIKLNLEILKSHYENMNKQVSEVHGSCKMFYRIIPNVESDLYALRKKIGSAV